jgi:lipoprotein-releasing system ATP-binding protein
MISLKLENISKDFTQAKQTFQVIKSANLSIKKGELVSLVGPSGSGKTTILQIAGLLDKQTTGKITINNQEINLVSDKDRTEIRKNNIGFIYQSHHLIAEFSVIENVMLPLLIQKKSFEVAKEKAQEILSQVELSDKLNFMPSQISGGQQQRVAIARAVVSNPSIILADEPTGNLDSTISNKIFELLQNIVVERNIGCLMVTHNLDLAKKSNRVLSIKDGIINDL